MCWQYPINILGVWSLKPSSMVSKIARRTELTNSDGI